MLKDFRETLVNDLQDPEFRRDFVIAYYEEDGMAGLRAALEEIAYADTVTAGLTAQTPSGDRAEEVFSSIRSVLNDMGLDLQVVRIKSIAETAGNRHNRATA